MHTIKQELILKTKIHLILCTLYLLFGCSESCLIMELYGFHFWRKLPLMLPLYNHHYLGDLFKGDWQYFTRCQTFLGHFSILGTVFCGITLWSRSPKDLTSEDAKRVRQRFFRTSCKTYLRVIEYILPNVDHSWDIFRYLVHFSVELLCGRGNISFDEWGCKTSSRKIFSERATGFV